MSNSKLFICFFQIPYDLSLLSQSLCYQALVALLMYAYMTTKEVDKLLSSSKKEVKLLAITFLCELFLTDTSLNWTHPTHVARFSFSN